MRWHTPETEEYGIASFVYRTAHPFDAEKLWDYVNDEDNWNGVLRSSGFFWLPPTTASLTNGRKRAASATCNPRACGGQPSQNNVGISLTATAPIKSPAGTRATETGTQELVFIGQNMDEAGIRTRLNACLLDATLAAADSRAWLNLPNPFPEFDMSVTRLMMANPSQSNTRTQDVTCRNG